MVNNRIIILDITKRGSKNANWDQLRLLSNI